MSRLTGYPRDAILGRNCRFLQGPDTDPAARATIRAALVRGRVVPRRAAQLSPRWHTLLERIDDQPGADAAGRVTHFIGVQADVTELRETMAHWPRGDARRADGLANREAFMGRLEELQAAAAPFAVLFVDLDSSRAVNDDAGHHTGDHVLQMIAERLRGRAADGERWRDRRGRVRLSETGRTASSGRARPQGASGGHRRAVAIGEYTRVWGRSVGIATERDAMDGARVLRAADAAMYRAKAGRENR